MRAAADLLGIAASSISRQIAQLERDLKIDLVEKGGHKIRLTAAGAALIDYYTVRIKAHEHLMDNLSSLRQGRINTVRIAVGDGLLTRHFTNALYATVRDHDDTTIDLITTSSYDVQRLIADDGAQIGLLFETPSDVHLRIHATIAQPIRLIMPADDPLRESSIIDLETVARQRLILPNGGLRLAEIIQSIFKDNELTLAPAVTASGLQPIVESVKSGLGLSLLPEMLVLDELQAGSLIARPIACPDFEETKVFLVTRAGLRLSDAGMCLLSSMAAVLARIAEGKWRSV